MGMVFPDGAAMLNEFIVRGSGQRGQAKKPAVIAQPPQCLGLARSLGVSPQTPPILASTLPDALFEGANLFQRKFKHRLEKTDAAIANVELRGVNADRNPAAARVAVVAGESALAPFVQLAIFGVRARGCAGMTRPCWSSARNCSMLSGIKTFRP